MDRTRDVPSDMGPQLRVMEALDQEYQDMCNRENHIVCLLQHCREQEMAIRTVLKMTEKTSTASQPQSRQNQESEALKRLEEALMGESSGDDDDSSA